MADITLLPSAKVPLIYDGELTMTTEWYRFFWNIYGFTGTGVVPVNKGGTGLNTIGNHQLIIGNANNVFEPASLSSASIAITYPAGFINLELGTSGVTPGTYGSASQVGVFTVNAYGVLTAASNTSIGIDASQIISGTLPVVRGGTGQSTYTNGQLLIGNSTGNTLTKATLTAGTGISVTNGAGSITIGNTGVLSVSGTAPVVSSGGATPAISMAAANTTTNGYLTSTDWNTFNNKAPATSGTSILYGNGSGGFSNVTIGSGISFAGGTLSATGSGGTITAVTGVAPIASSGGTTPAISISQATTSTNGYLSSTDWNTFNNKQPAGTYVTSISIASSNGFTGTSSGGATPSLTLATSVTGILKGNGTAISAATSGTDYAPATSGTFILYGNGAGGFSNVTIGTGVSFAGGTLSATGSGGTVTSVAALTLGTTGTDLSSTVANSTTTPVITLNVPTASAANRGALSAADWSTFNGKQAALVSGTNIKTVGGNTLLGSGDVGTINVGYGGTGLTSVTAGYIPFGSTATALSTDITLFWNNTNKVLGVGTATPFSYASRLAVVGGGNTAAFIGGGATNIGSISTGRSVIDLTIGTAGSTNQFFTGVASGDSIVAFGSGKLWFGSGNYNASGSPFAIIHASGGVSIGNTTDPGANNLTVAGIIYANTTSLPTGLGAGKVVVAGAVNTNCVSQQAPSSSGNYFFQDFVCGTTEVGYIRSSNGTTLNYTSISDYRLKTNVQPMTSALETVSKLNPCTYNWLKDNSKGQGFIAHELQAVVPDCVTGEKDAVNDEGKPIYQGVDTSFLVATLTAAIQELNTKFDAYVASHP